jgi:hypothetical protein
LDNEGNTKLLAVPNMRVLDIVKQGLDDIVRTERNEITGRLTMKGKLVNDLRDDYLAEIDKLDTKGIYKKARETWQGPSASFDAMNFGRSVFGNTPEAIAEHVARLSPANQEFVRTGVADILRERLLKTGFSGDEAKALVKNEWMRRQLRPVFKSEKEFDKFVDGVTSERNMFENSRKFAGGSDTAERMAQDQDFIAAAHGVGAAKNLFAGKLINSAAEAFRMYRYLGSRKPDPEFVEKIARIIFQAPLTQENRLLLQGAKNREVIGRLKKFSQDLRSRGEAGTAGAAGAASGEALGGMPE